jgi:hypothetical protein
MGMERGVLFTAWVGSYMVIISCTDPDRIILAPTVDPRVGQMAIVPKEIRPEEQAFADLEALAPLTAGFYFDSDTLVVVTNIQTAERAKAALAHLAARGFNGRRIVPSHISVREARFTFSQLAAWRDIIFTNLLGSAGITSLDLNERENRVVIGIRPAQAAELRTTLPPRIAALGINPEAVIYREVADLNLQVRTTAAPIVPERISHTADTVVGGLRVGLSRSYGNPVSCTLGFVAGRGGERGYVTASHCTELLFDVDNSEMSQASGARAIGHEVTDPEGWTCGIFFHECRVSDGSFFTTYEGIPSARGLIARPASKGTGTLDWDQSNPYFMITEVENNNMWSGDPVDMVGSFGGWSGGTIQSTCEDFPLTGEKMVTCAYEANYRCIDGDSGAPVFRRLVGTEVKLAGIHTGDQNNETRCVFSKYYRIVQNLGSIVATRQPLLATPTLSGSLYPSSPYSLPRISWNSVPGATFYKIYRRMCDYDGECDSDFLYFGTEESPFIDPVDVNQYLGTSYPPPHIRKWVGYFVQAFAPYDLSQWSNKVYFKRP